MIVVSSVHNLYLSFIQLERDSKPIANFLNHLSQLLFLHLQSTTKTPSSKFHVQHRQATTTSDEELTALGERSYSHEHSTQHSSSQERWRQVEVPELHRQVASYIQETKKQQDIDLLVWHKKFKKLMQTQEKSLHQVNRGMEQEFNLTEVIYISGTASVLIMPDQAD